MPVLENTPLRTNIEKNIFISHWFLCETKTIPKYVFANKIIRLWSDSNTEPLNQNGGEQ
jgi:hypothetical protein